MAGDCQGPEPCQAASTGTTDGSTSLPWGSADPYPFSQTLQSSSVTQPATDTYHYAPVSWAQLWDAEQRVQKGHFCAKSLLVHALSDCSITYRHGDNSEAGRRKMGL